MKPNCPHCHHCQIHTHGSFRRKSDSKIIKRFKCPNCLKTFSLARFSENFRQHKRRLNPHIFNYYASGVSIRRMALVLKTTTKTIERKIIFLASLERKRHEEFLKALPETELSHLQFDDLITSHHTKLKPVSVSAVVSRKNRYILNVSVSTIPAFGKLSEISKKKYGKRKNELPQKLQELFFNLSKILPETGIIDTDKHKLYPEPISKNLPKWSHQEFNSEKAAVAGQGELKQKVRDPLFAINHTLAMFRASMNRLFRRTWNTTKNLDRLYDHLWIYIGFHNRNLILN